MKIPSNVFLILSYLMAIGFGAIIVRIQYEPMKYDASRLLTVSGIFLGLVFLYLTSKKRTL